MGALKSREKAAGTTIGEHLTFLLPRLSSDPKIPRWPPDVFALCASLLLESGAYCQALSDWPPARPLHKSPSRWVPAVEKLGGQWRSAWAQNAKIPEPVSHCWTVLRQNWHLPVSRIRDHLDVNHAILQLFAAADEASAGVGSPHPEDQDPTDEIYHFRADGLLEHRDAGSTLCDEIHSSRARVLPKMHTPSSGLTLRSLSLYLALCTVEEVCPEWVLLGSYPQRENMNLLLVPWPFTIVPAQFQETRAVKGEMRNMPEEFGFFSFVGSTKPGVIDTVQHLYESAEADMGRIDGVILPELALSAPEHKSVRDLILEKGAFLVSGVGEPSVPGKKHGVNRVHFDLPHEDSLAQSKHHRWRLDPSQIRQYGLGSRLSIEKNWWEHVGITDRRLLFVSLNPALVMSVLICEDLARPDPVGELVRAVGPNLVIALLMDGPQLQGRWPERYAMALADDPGSSVLSLTSLGMSMLSRPARGPRRSRVVALWKDRTGVSTEIELPENCGGIVLSLSFQFLEEWTADGRRDYGAAGLPTLSGIHPVRLP